MTHTDWKKLTAPPSIFAFNVTTAAPTQIITNTPVNIGTACLSGAFILSTLHIREDEL